LGEKRDISGEKRKIQSRSKKGKRKKKGREGGSFTGGKEGETVSIKAKPEKGGLLPTGSARHMVPG